ncbi:MAG: YdcF family protein [Bacteroidota bacterium]
MNSDFSTGHRVRRALFPWLCFLSVFASIAYAALGALLSYSAELPHGADVIVVLGGGSGARYAMGVELLSDGYSGHLVLINPTISERHDVASIFHRSEVGVDDLPRNSWQEAKAVRAWMEAYGWRSVLVVSDPPHMLRLRYTWSSVFRGSDLKYSLVATSPDWWSPWRWWDNPKSAHFVTEEVIKMLYYIVAYKFGI